MCIYMYMFLFFYSPQNRSSLRDCSVKKEEEGEEKKKKKNERQNDREKDAKKYKTGKYPRRVEMENTCIYIYIYARVYAERTGAAAEKGNNIRLARGDGAKDLGFLLHLFFSSSGGFAFRHLTGSPRKGVRSICGFPTVLRAGRPRARACVVISPLVVL